MNVGFFQSVEIGKPVDTVFLSSLHQLSLPAVYAWTIPVMSAKPTYSNSKNFWQGFFFLLSVYIQLLPNQRSCSLTSCKFQLDKGLKHQ